MGPLYILIIKQLELGVSFCCFISCLSCFSISTLLLLFYYILTTGSHSLTRHINMCKEKSEMSHLLSNVPPPFHPVPGNWMELVPQPYFTYLYNHVCTWRACFFFCPRKLDIYLTYYFAYVCCMCVCHAVYKWRSEDNLVLSTHFGCLTGTRSFGFQEGCDTFLWICRYSHACAHTPPHTCIHIHTNDKPSLKDYQGFSAYLVAVKMGRGEWGDVLAMKVIFAG